MYRQLEPNERGHYPIEQMPVELGLWRGNYQNQTQLWLRWWDKDGNLLLTGHEQAELQTGRAEREQKLAQQERERAQQERERADRLEQERTSAISRLQQLGLSVEQIASALNLSVELVKNSTIN